MKKAKAEGHENFEVWGSGNALREFLHIDDLVSACIKIIKCNNSLPNIINIGSGEELSIKELAFLIKGILDYQGEIIFDRTKPDGIKRKILDSCFVKSMNWKADIKLQQGLSDLIKYVNEKS